MNFDNLELVSLSNLIETYNQAFSDYIVSVQLNKEQFSNKLKGDRVNLNLSVGAYENDELIGCILHGIDEINHEKVAYNAGTGVIPKFRGNQLTEKMYAFILPKLKQEGIRNVFLEVITENIKAHSIYSKIGFTINRNFNCFYGLIDKSINYKNDFQFKKINTIDWPTFKLFWDIEPSWQGSINAINNIKKDLICYIAEKNNQIIGYIIYNSINSKILQIAVAKNERRKGIARQLVQQINEKQIIYAINIDENSISTNSFFASLGLQLNIKQYEMILEI